MNSYEIESRPCGRQRDGQKVLTIEGGDDNLGSVAQVHFQHHGEMGPRIVVQGTWTGGDMAKVPVQGSALAAFRDLLNELPEEAFGNPEPEWQGGDVVLYQGTCKATYTRLESGPWVRVWLGESIEARGAVSDHDIDRMLRGRHYKVLRRGGVDVG